MLIERISRRLGLNEVIKKCKKADKRSQDDVWCVYSEKGKLMGRYRTKEEAEKRLKQIEYFKHKESKAMKRRVKEQYEGWKNWETWLVFTYLTSDERVYEEAVERAEAGSNALSRWVETELMRIVRPRTRGDVFEMMLSEMVLGLLEEVDWNEVREGLLGE
jgi:hypothetical protein